MLGHRIRKQMIKENLFGLYDRLNELMFQIRVEFFEVVVVNYVLVVVFIPDAYDRLPCH